MIINSFKKFLYKFSLYTFIIWLVSFVLYRWLPQMHVNIHYTYILLFLYIVSIATFYLASKSIDGRISKLANMYMLLNFGRLLLFSIIIFVYAFLHNSDVVSFILTFFTYYLLLTLWEVVALQRKKQ